MNKNSIRIVDNYIVAGDEIPNQDSKFYTFPSLTKCSDGSFLCTTLVGSEKTGPDGRIKVFKSVDACKTWNEIPSPILHDEQANSCWGYVLCHITELTPGHLLAIYLRSDRSNPNEPLFHSETSGMKPTISRLCESFDNGCTWSLPWNLDYKLPDLLAPGNFLKLPDGSLGMPFEVWHEWDKGFKEGPSTRLIVSQDNGKSWVECGMIAWDWDCCLAYGDPRLTILPDGRLLVLLWTFNCQTMKDLTVHRSISSDNGSTWSPVESTDLVGQIANPAALSDGRTLVVYQKRFGEDAGLRAVLSHDDCLTFDFESDILIWNPPLKTALDNPFKGYEEYSFGYSTVFKLSDSEALAPLWVNNGKTTYIRILKLEIN